MLLRFYLKHDDQSCIDLLIFPYWYDSGEAERIKNCKGRILSVDEEPEVYRLWMPDEDCPGLAMSRAFGDFCVKDCGLISIPEVSYRRISSSDEFVVLATDGVGKQHILFTNI